MCRFINPRIPRHVSERLASDFTRRSISTEYLFCTRVDASEHLLEISDASISL